MMNTENKVTKSNVLVLAHYNMTVEQFRIIHILASLIQPQDKDFQSYTFKISEFMELIGVDTKTKYTDIPKITESLMKKILKIWEGNSLIQISWLYYAKHDKGAGTITLKFAPELKPYLLSLKERFVTYSLKNVLNLTSTYSQRLYDILKDNEYKETYELKIADLAEMFQLSKSYSDFYEIRRRIIEPAKAELAEKTDITFNYEEVKVRKKVVALKFHIRANPKYEKKSTSTLPALPEPQKPLEQMNNAESEDEISQQTAHIQRIFQKSYKGELATRFVIEMLQKKGYAHIMQCLTDYRKYIDGQNIRNIAGHFYKFVIEGYTEPVSHKGNVPQRDNFEQREYSDEFYESCYTNFIDMGIAPVRKK